MLEFVSPLALLGTTLFMIAVQHLWFSRPLFGRYLGTTVPEMRTPVDVAILAVTLSVLLLVSTNMVMYVRSLGVISLPEVLTATVVGALAVLTLLAQWTGLSLRQLGIYAGALIVVLGGGVSMILFWPW